MIKILFVLMLLGTVSWGQVFPDTAYRVEVAVTASPSVSFFRASRIPGRENTPSVGYAFFVRGMWHPSRLLAVGVMTGYCSIARDEIPVEGSLPGGFTNSSARLSAIPLQLAISMQKKRIEGGMGVGPYLMMTTIDNGNGVHAHGMRFEFGITLFGSYFLPLNDRMVIGPEVRMLYLGYRGILSVMPSVSFRIDALRY